MDEKKSYKQYNIVRYMAAFALIAVILLICFTMIFNINRRMNESATSSLLSTTQVLEGNLTNYIEKDFESLQVVGELYKTGGSLEGVTFDELCKTMGLEWIGIFPEDGDGRGFARAAFDVSQKAWYEQWKPGEKGYSDTYYGDSGRLTTTLWTPVYENGDLVATVFGDVLLTKYYSANVFTFYNGEGRTYLFDSSTGEWILKSLGSDGLPALSEDIYSLLTESGNSKEDVAAFRLAVEAGQIGTAVFNFNGEPSHICFIPLSSSPDWYVVTVIAKDVLMKESTQVQRMIQLLLLLFCCAILVFAIVFIKWQNRQTKFREASYREALFSNIFSNVDTVFLLYDKEKEEAVFVSDNVNRILGVERGRLRADIEMLFDWCGMGKSDETRAAFLSGVLDKSVMREVCVENEVGFKTRYMRLELIPADFGQEIIMLTDITADKDIQNSLVEAMQRAESASRAKNEFLSSMSHDIRTPMNGIIGMTAIAAAHIDDGKRVRDCLNKISEASAHLLNLINEVLDMSRIESGKMELSEEPFNLGALLQEVLNMNIPGIRQKNHNIKVHIHLMEHEQVVGDSGRMQRIIANLLSNAIKYTPDGGNIFLALEEKPSEIKGYGCYELTVQDDGIGMSEAFLEKLFRPFEREDDVRLKKIQGTGLGMSITKNIVSLMMGRIEVESGKNRGTTFRVTVNLKLDKDKNVLSEKLEKLPVLVVDDDKNVCETVTNMLFDIGMTGEWVDNGEAAIGMVSKRHRRREDYMAVLLDWKMPGMDGIETARRIRAEVGDTVPVIILTAYDWSEIEEEARAAGVDEFLSKPLYKSKLKQKMLAIADKPAELLSLPEGDNRPPIPGGKRVLIAEDNQLNREITVELLGMLDIETVTAEDGAAVVKAFAESAVGFYDLILMDIQMPEMNGYDAARTIRAMARRDGGTIPIVAMTADAFAEDIQAANAAGMNEHISKPISIDRLIQVLEEFLTPQTEVGE